MSSTVELSKYDCKVTIRSRPSTILFIKERLSKSNKRLKLFKDIVFGKYLDLDVEDNDNHLLNYLLHHQRPQLSKSIDSNLVFDIAGHTLLFGRLEFYLVTDFICGKVVFPEYMDDGIPPFLRRMFPDKAKNLENKASLGKATQGKAAKGKAAEGLRSLIWDVEKWKKLSVEDSIRVCLLYMSEQIFMRQEDKKVVNNSFLRLVEDLASWDDFSWGEYYWEEFYKKAVNLIDNHRDTHINFKKKNPSKLPTYSIYGFAWAFKANRTSAGAKVEETKSSREVALEEELDLWKFRYVELESNYKNLEASVEIARKNSPGLSFPTTNAKATSVCDDIDEADAAADDNSKATSVCDDINEADAAADDNAKATSVHDDVGVPDAAADDNAKATSVHDDVCVPDVVTDDNANATSVCDDINEADAGTDDNAKATSVHDDVGVPDAAADDNAKATSVCDDINKADAAADDNVKATSVHDDVGVPDASADDNAKATSVHDDVGVPDAAADDNAKDTSVCDDINQADAASYDNAKVPLSDVYNTLVDNENVLMKDAHEINNHIDPPIHGFQIMLWGGLDEGKANR
ncbi:phospholipase-like protein, partial [Tanacetum coccineum]